MLARIADLGIRSPRRVLLIAALVLIGAAAFGGQVQKHLSAGGFSDPRAPSSRANDLLASRLHAGNPNLVLEVEAAGGVDSPAARAEGRRLVTALAAERYASQISSYWTASAEVAPALRSDDGRSGLVVARIAGDDDQSPKRAGAIVERITAVSDPNTKVIAGGIAMAYHQVTNQVSEDLKIAEAVAVPLTVLVLIWVFGSFVAALLPLAVGIFAIVGTLAVLRALALATHVSIYAMNLTTALGLALAIDYSLFVVSRFREELAAGREGPATSVDAAIRRTMQTAGRTVLFSALTVALSLAALLVFPVYFLRSFAYAGVAVVGLSAVAALVILPALLRLLGPQVNSLDVRVPVRRWLHRPPRPVVVEQSFWYRLASAVMRRAVPVGLSVVALLLVLGAPFLGVKFGYPDDRVLPRSASTHQVGDALRDQFSANASAPVTVVVPDVSVAPDAIGRYARALSQASGVTNVVSSTATFAGGRPVAAGNPAMRVGDATYLVANTSADPMSSDGKHVLAAVKDTPTPWPVQITGTAAENADSLHSLGAMLPLALALIALATFAVLFLFTGSVVLPIKALVLNTLSLSATFGAMVWIFQDGHFASIYDATVTGFLVPTMPILMFCLAFGMSMDYEVFLLSRIREEWLTFGNNERAVAVGLGRTGRIVTAAAVLMAIVFAALATSKVSFMQMFGTGLALAVLMDATLVRGVLVPSFMRLAGRANWWAPVPLARWHRRFGLSDAPAGHRELVST
jgi:putative drug exporter of the RND superfamily